MKMIIMKNFPKKFHNRPTQRIKVKKSFNPDYEKCACGKKAKKFCCSGKYCNKHYKEHKEGYFHQKEMIIPLTVVGNIIVTKGETRLLLDSKNEVSDLQDNIQEEKTIE